MRKQNIVVLFLIILLVACSNEKGEGNQSTQDMSPAESEGFVREAEDLEEAAHTEEVSESFEEVEAAEAQYIVNDAASVIPINEDADENIVLLTIDDAPADYSLQMAETLKELDADAIFFVNGHFLTTEEDEQVLKKIHEMGFLIGNHTYNHAVLPNLSETKQREEIISLSNRIEEIIGERPKFFRAPHGMNSEYSIDLAEEEGMVVMNWTYGYDYFDAYMDKDKLTEAMVTGEGPEAGVNYSLLKPGANLLMHDRKWTSEALEGIITGLRSSGYEIVDPKLIKVE